MIPEVCCVPHDKGEGTPVGVPENVLLYVYLFIFSPKNARCVMYFHLSGWGIYQNKQET